MTFSDYLLIGCLVSALVFALNFSLGPPRVWFRDPLGWVIFAQALSVFALLALIVYAVVFGQKVDEAIRIPVTALLFLSLIGKNVILHIERTRGRMPYERPEKPKRKANA